MLMAACMRSIIGDCTIRFVGAGSMAILTDKRNQNNMWRPFIRQRTKFTVAIEGNIGSGKSTLLDFFRRFYPVQTMNEQISRWTSIGGRHNALKLLYEDPKRWSFLFNNYAGLTRLQMHMMRVAEPVKMMERSLQSTRFVFIENSFRYGHLSEMEYQVLVEWFDFINETQDIKVNLFVYLRASPEICLERVRTRARPEEKNITINFLRDLHTLHENFFVHRTTAPELCIPVLILDASQDLETMSNIYAANKSLILGDLFNTF